MKTRTVTIRVPIIPFPNWWTITRWTVWIIAVMIVRWILIGTDFWAFMSVVCVLAIGGAVFTYDPIPPSDETAQPKE